MRAQRGALIEAVITQLLALLRPDEPPAALKDVQVMDGPARADDDLRDDLVQVAPGTPEEPGVVVQRVREPGMGRVVYRTRIEIVMIISSYSGSTDMSKRRARAVALYNAVKDLVDANQQRDDVWDSLSMGEEEQWSQVQSGAGATCFVGFTIVAEAVG